MPLDRPSTMCSARAPYAQIAVPVPANRNRRGERREPVRVPHGATRRKPGSRWRMKRDVSPTQKGTTSRLRDIVDLMNSNAQVPLGHQAHEKTAGFATASG
ncbi:protein of unknown function [Burkholderia multivorans]